MDEPSPSLKVCPVCGGDRFTNESVLWPELIAQWELSPDENHARLALKRDGRPGLIVFSTCRNLIRTLPAIVYSRTYPEDIDDSCEQYLVAALRYGLGRKRCGVGCCLCVGFELFVGFQMDNGVAELEAAFADLHLEFRHYPGIENSDAGSKPGKMLVGIDCGSLSSAMFSRKDGRVLQADAIFCR